MVELSPVEYRFVDFGKPEELLSYAKKLEGHTFQEVLNLGITPEDAGDGHEYGKKSFKGGMGTLVEERYFGYKANDNPAPDFEEAGVELKTTCYDTKKDGSIRAGERLVLSMIAFDESIEAPLEESHMWEKGGNILLIYYKRDKDVSKYEQEIEYVTLFTPPEEDLAIIREDYETIQRYVMEGRADELSESLTNYLGACTKGANAEKSMRDQKVYAPGKKARSRAWSYKNSYMNSVLHDYILGQRAGESIVKDASALENQTFDEYALSLIRPYIGLTDKEICRQLGLEYTGNKHQWVTIVYRMLGIKSNQAEEFVRANINVRTVRIEENSSVKESLSLDTFRFKELVRETWDDSPLHIYFEETRFFFVAFQEVGGELVLKGATFWSMPAKDIDGPLLECWERTVRTLKDGVQFTVKMQKNGKLRVSNNLPGKTDGPVAHVRPHAGNSAYFLFDGTELGDIGKDGDELPDGQWMTKQSFWLNNDYIYEIVKDIQ